MKCSRQVTADRSQLARHVPAARGLSPGRTLERSGAGPRSLTAAALLSAGRGRERGDRAARRGRRRRRGRSQVSDVALAAAAARATAARAVGRGRRRRPVAHGRRHRRARPAQLGARVRGCRSPAPGSRRSSSSPNITTTYAAGVCRPRQILLRRRRDRRRPPREPRRPRRQRGGPPQVAADLALAGRLAYWEAVRADAARDAATASSSAPQRLLADTQRPAATPAWRCAPTCSPPQERLASARVAVIRAADAAGSTPSPACARCSTVGAATTLELADRLARRAARPPGAARRAPARGARAPPRARRRSPRSSPRSRPGRPLALAPVRPSPRPGRQWDLARPNQRYFPLTDEWHDSWSVGLGGELDAVRRRQGARRRAAARAGQQRARRRARGRGAARVPLEVELARRDLRERARRASSAADAARAAADRARAGQLESASQAGLAPMVEILDAQAELAAAEQQQVNVRAAAWLAAAALERAVGR